MRAYVCGMGGLDCMEYMLQGGIGLEGPNA